MKPILRCILLVIFALNFSTGANGACDPTRYFGYWSSDELNMQILTACRLNSSGEADYPRVHIWSSQDGIPYQVGYGTDYLAVRFDKYDVVINRPNDNNQHQLLVEKFDLDYKALVNGYDENTPRETFLLNLSFIDPSDQPSGICEVSPFDGYWSEKELFEASPAGLEIQIRTLCGISSSGADSFEIQILLSENRIPLRVKNVSDNGDHLSVKLKNGTIIFIHLPDNGRILVDRLNYGETKWQRSFLINRHQIPE